MTTKLTETFIGTDGAQYTFDTSYRDGRAVATVYDTLDGDFEVYVEWENRYDGGHFTLDGFDTFAEARDALMVEMRVA